MRRSLLAIAALALLGARPAHAQDFVIRRWLVRGALHADTGRAGVVRDYLGGEAAVRPDSGELVAGGPFFPADADSTGHIDFNAVLPGAGDWTVGYAHAWVFAPAELTCLLVMDSDDDIVGYLNGQRVWVHVVPRGIGLGRDTVLVRLAGGWNSLLLKVVNRGGGFDVLGRLAPALGEAPLAGVRSQLRRPAGLTATNLPASTMTVSALQIGGPVTWNRGALETRASLQVAAWGRDTLRGVTVRLVSDTTTRAADTLGTLAPGEPVTLRFAPDAAALRSAALGATPLRVELHWAGGSRDAPLTVNADGLLRQLGGRLALGGWHTDSSGGRPSRLTSRFVVPAVFDGQTLDMLAAEHGPRARYEVAGWPGTWREGVVNLCAPCHAGDTLDVAIALDTTRVLWSFPAARVRAIGYREYADGYDYARMLTGAAPAIARPDPQAWLAVLTDPAARDSLASRYAAAYAGPGAQIRRDTLHLVGNSHIDAAWLWPWSETIDVIRRTWRSSLKIASAFPGYVFAASSGAFFDAMDRLEPTLADSLTAAVADGRFAIIGGFWVEPDQNLPSGESLARQGLYGQRYFQHRFGRRARVGWTPDSFGYPWTLPQIYRELGLDAFVTQKIRWNDSTELPYNAFFWEGRDGTRLFTYNPYGYDHDLDPHRLVEQRIDDRQRPGTSHHMLVLYGVGDHGGGPTMEMLHRAEESARIPTFPVMRFDTPDHALSTMRTSLGDAGFPVWRDELYLEYHRGTYTTQSWMKAGLRRSETVLRTTEALAALDTAAYPQARLEGAWRRVLFNQFHDILPGSSIHQVYLDANAQYDSAWATLDSIRADAFAGLRARMNTRPPRRGLAPVVVFNPLPWPRGGFVTVPRGAGTAELFVPNVPALGARVLWTDRADRLVGEGGRTVANAHRAATAGADWIQNDFLRVEVDRGTGTITRIYDRRTQREVLAPGARGNVLELFGDRPQNWDAWDIGYTGERWEVDSVVAVEVHTGNGGARLAITRRFGASTFAQELVLERDLPYLDVRNTVDWHERRRLLKVGFTLATAPDSLTCEIPYGTIGRTGRPRTKAERAKYEFPCQRWVDASDSTGGAGFFTDNKYGWDWHDNVLRLSLLRAPVWPDSLADRGRQVFRFAVFPHAGDWRSAHVERHAAEYNTPLIAAPEPPHAGPLDRAFSAASVDAPNVEITWIKRAEDSNALVLRLVEWHGRPATATVSLRNLVRSARRANLLEDPGESLPVQGRTIRVTLRPYEIATILVDTQP